jgi:hypothetical protein
MGIFSKRHEEPAESKLPAEPDIRPTDAELLGERGPDAGEPDFLTDTSQGTAWIQIPASPGDHPEPYIPEDDD